MSQDNALLLGPNDEQVYNLVLKLLGLSADDWRLVDVDKSLARAAFGEVDRGELELLCQGEYGAEAVLEWRNGLGSLLAPYEDDFPQRLFAGIRVAAEAVLFAGALTKGMFWQSYGWLSDMIPVEDLGPGLAPPVPRLQRTFYERFITRLQCLESNKWNQVFELASMVDLAIGIERYEQVLENARVQVLSMAKRGEIDSAAAKAMMSSMKAIDSVLSSAYEPIRDIFQNISTTLGRPEGWAEMAYKERFAHKEEICREAARAALFGLIGLIAGLSLNELSVLYLPFAGVIPLETLYDPV